MRTLAVAAITSLIALIVASVASAAPSVSLVWTGTSGSGTPGSSSIASVVGDTLTLDILITADSDGVNASGVSYDLNTAGTVTGGVIWSGADGIVTLNGLTTYNPVDNITNTATYGGAGTLQYVGGTGVSCPFPATGNAKTGCALGYLVTGATGSDQGNGIVGTFTAGGAGGFATVYTYTQARASFQVVPEPATGGLLALGLGALVFIGRRRA
jgi:hypothetical protein